MAICVINWAFLSLGSVGNLIRKMLLDRLGVSRVKWNLEYFFYCWACLLFETENNLFWIYTFDKVDFKLEDGNLKREMTRNGFVGLN